MKVLMWECGKVGVDGWLLVVGRYESGTECE